MWGGGGGAVPWGRRHWVGINFCHPEVVKLQQQCHMQNTIFDLHPPPPPPPPTASIVVYFWERESANISWRQQQENWKENANDNPVRKCSSIITLIFRFFMTLARHSGNQYYLEKARYALPPLYMESHEEELHQLTLNSHK